MIKNNTGSFERGAKTTPKDFFLYVGVMATLYISTISILGLLFQIIDSVYVDPLAYYDPYSTGVSLAIAALLVIFPVFLVLSWVIRKGERRVPAKREVWVRKWLLYLTVFVAGGAVAIDLIVLLYHFLSGQVLTASFLWKILAVLFVLGAIFGYFLYKIREEMSDRVAQVLSGLVVLFVLGAIIAGFFVMGSPQAQREMRLDHERVNDLQNIQFQVVRYWELKRELPETLMTFKDSLKGFSVSVDPQTGKSYGYEVTGDLSFKLCAVFGRAMTQVDQSVVRHYPTFGVEVDGRGAWSHSAGRDCFTRTIDPELHPDPLKSLKQ